ncbi:putative protease (secreted protein) [Streptomyces ambofaciens ATCC 23877]|uniref:Putative protease (Putative secreted protein) n=1 Tax=Streptomyces ambofaciens (strain ATCC 23877 / 3486 / DSM 40053 / JCM 4204 / NBRC 12836 / NRRL B-2516) TaxID=278992 RepID=A3KJI0_STRA7|nr:alpha/beta hydrolase [Streptomyces ambofaciens]AKZ54014.1 putative protease (secreted protein) [Streptomyces ambofaciens ATCC 23877]CAJ89865.1 putative protease (putative secreted protein) [Streptomyces ambofaciens ATCC 23877]
MLAKQSNRPAARRRAVTGALGLALLGAGLPAVTATANEAEPGTARFYDQKITWSACEGMDVPKDLQCGKVTVPLDYDRPGSGTLDLALARYPATTDDPRGSVLLNFGGPGGSGVSELSAGGKEFMHLTNDYDVVTFDPRGVGRSSPVTCGPATVDIIEATNGDETLTEPEDVLRRLRDAAAECAEHSGPVLRHIGTVDAARDLDVMRRALGDDRLNYLGFSYGTRLGAVYAAQFPDKVGRMVLDGVDTLTEPLTEQGLAGARGQQTALENFLDWCVEDIACPFGQDARDARRQVEQVIASLDEDPVPTGFGEPFSGQDMVGAVGQALYSEELWPSLQRALAQLMEDGDTRGLEGFVSGGVTFPVRAPKPAEDRERAGGGLTDQEDVPMDNLPAALMAINCADDPDRPSAAQVAGSLGRLRERYEEASPVFGRYRLTQVLMCYGRPKGTDYIRDDVKDLDTARMLLVGTRGDPATPYRWTEETAERLGAPAVVLDNKGEGHTGYASSECVHRKVDDFLLYGSLPADGSSCGSETPRSEDD